jgi:glycosyltransferase involved in cell wall biosynthesis
MDRPLCSVCIPVFNGRDTIAYCLDSVLAQTCKDLEICVSDNASTDGTADILRNYAAQHARLRVQAQPSNIGAAANFDAVRKMARGKYFMWLGSDDRICPSYIEKLVGELEKNPSSRAAQAATIVVNDKGEIVRRAFYDPLVNPNLRGPIAQAINMLSFRKKIRNRKLNFFIYGVYDRRAVEHIVTAIGNPLKLGDSVLPAMAALAGGLRYVDEFLYIRHVYSVNFKVRRSDDPILQERVRQNRPLNLLKWALACPNIPLHRSLSMILIVLPLAARKTVLSCIRLLPKKRREELKRASARLGWLPWKSTTGKF